MSLYDGYVDTAARKTQSVRSDKKEYTAFVGEGLKFNTIDIDQLS